MTNRRDFFKQLALGVASFTVLPSAATYSRKWVRTPTKEMWVPNPEYVDAPYELAFIHSSDALEVLPLLSPRGRILPNQVRIDYPLRYKVNPDGSFEVVEPTIKLC